jgi:hypothetical protein
MESMVLERLSEQTEVVAEQLAPMICAEQLELNLGLTTAERRLLNANAIMHALSLGEHVSLDAANPKVVGTETAGIVMRVQRGNAVSGF